MRYSTGCDAHSAKLAGKRSRIVSLDALFHNLSFRVACLERGTEGRFRACDRNARPPGFHDFASGDPVRPPGGGSGSGSFRGISEGIRARRRGSHQETTTVVHRKKQEDQVQRSDRGGRPGVGGAAADSRGFRKQPADRFLRDHPRRICSHRNAARCYGDPVGSQFPGYDSLRAAAYSRYAANRPDRGSLATGSRRRRANVAGGSGYRSRP